MNLYYMLFGLTRPSCLPLPELGLVLNLKEKKAVLNPTIKPEMGAGAVMDTPASIGVHGVGISFTAVSDVISVDGWSCSYFYPRCKLWSFGRRLTTSLNNSADVIHEPLGGLRFPPV